MEPSCNMPFSDESKPAGSGDHRRILEARPALRQVQNVPIKRQITTTTTKKLNIEPATANMHTQTENAQAAAHSTRTRGNSTLATNIVPIPVVPEIKISLTTLDANKTENIKVKSTASRTSSRAALTSSGTLLTDISTDINSEAATAGTCAEANTELGILDDKSVLDSTIKPENESKHGRTSAARPALKQVQKNVPIKRTMTKIASVTTKKSRFESATTNVETQTSLISQAAGYATKKRGDATLASHSSSIPVKAEVKIPEATLDAQKTAEINVKSTSSSQAQKTIATISTSTEGKSRIIQIHKANIKPEDILDNNTNLSSAIKLLDEYRKRRNANITLSPIPPNASVGKNILLARYVEQPARKKTLSRSKGRRDEYSPYSGDIFNVEYLTENLDDAVMIDQRYIGNRNFLNAFNSHLTGTHRTKILKWILSIADDIKLSKRVYFKFVRLLDNIFENLHVPRNVAQLVAIVTCWILLKMHEVTYPGAKKLASLCANTYTIKEILHMEMKLLVYTQFNLLISSPSDFYFYLQLVDSNEQLWHCINYILEQFTLDMRYSQYSSADLSSAATYLAAHCLQIDFGTMRIFKPLDSVREIVFLMDVQMNQIHTIQKKEHDRTGNKWYKILLEHYKNKEDSKEAFYFS